MTAQEKTYYREVCVCARIHIIMSVTFNTQPISKEVNLYTRFQHSIIHSLSLPHYHHNAYACTHMHCVHTNHCS